MLCGVVLVAAAPDEMIILAIAVPHVQTVKKLKFSTWDTVSNVENHVLLLLFVCLFVFFKK